MPQSHRPASLSGEPPPAVLERLTPAERQVLDLALEGLSARAIADELVLSEATIRSHLTRIYAKLGVRGRVELLAMEGNQGPAHTPAQPGAAASGSPYGAAPWAATGLAVAGLAVGLVAPLSGVLVGPALIVLALALGRQLPAELRWARIPLLGVGAILSVQAAILTLFLMTV
jgi:DNA-binding CsgD family transcriptional regulator